MFSHDTQAFKLAALSLYGCTYVNSNEATDNVIMVIKARQRFVKTLEGDALQIVRQAFGFISDDGLESDE